MTLEVSAWDITALKSFRLMATCTPSSAPKYSKSVLSIATDVCTGCLSVSTPYISIRLSNIVYRRTIPVGNLGSEASEDHLVVFRIDI